MTIRELIEKLSKLSEEYQSTNLPIWGHAHSYEIWIPNEWLDNEKTE